MAISIRCVTGRVYSLSVEEGVSVLSLKEELSLLTGLSPDQLQLISGSSLLRDSSPLHLPLGEEIQLLTTVRAGALLYIKTFQGTTITIEVDLDYDTIAVVKHKIEDRIGISKDGMILVFNDNDLADERNLRSYGLKREDTLHLVPRKDIKQDPAGADQPGQTPQPAVLAHWWQRCNII